jgi:hypothetical protein
MGLNKTNVAMVYVSLVLLVSKGSGWRRGEEN